MTNSEIVIVTVYFFLSISFLVVMHELGHYLAARYFKTKVEKFYLFFDPWFALWKRKIGDTEYGIGWLPLGGYVKIAGMVDESLDTDELAQPPKDYEFRSKPAWQRLIIMLGGIIVNVFLGIFIFAMLLWRNGEVKLAPENCQYGMHFSETMKSAGFQDGDIITRVNGEKLEDYGSWAAEIILADGQSSMDVMRRGESLHIPVPDSIVRAIQAQKDSIHVQPLIPFEIAEVSKDGPSKGLLEPGDQVVGVGDKSPLYMQEIRPIIAAHKNQAVDLLLSRDGEPMEVRITPDSNGHIGVYLNTDPNTFFTLDTLHYGFFKSLRGGYDKAKIALGGQAKGMYKMATDDKVSAKDNLGGFLTIAKLFPSTWGDWTSFWRITALLSLILAFMNLLPIPALDGGHVVFLLYEMITGRPPSLRFMEIAQVAGMILVLGLIVYINGREIIQAFFG